MATSPAGPDPRLAHLRPTPASVRQLRPAEPTHALEGYSDDLRSRLLGEFSEMPGLCLTVAQACRLFDLTEMRCALVLREMTEAGLLRLRADGRYVLKHDAA